jgi:hypothetical protein
MHKGEFMGSFVSRIGNKYTFSDRGKFNYVEGNGLSFTEIQPDTTYDDDLVIGDGKCWRHKGKYLGKYLSSKLVGSPRDPDIEMTFDKGVVRDIRPKFTMVPCAEAAPAPRAYYMPGGKRKQSYKRRKTLRKPRNSRKTTRR